MEPVDPIINELVNKAIHCWVDATGVDLSKNSYTISLGGGVDDYWVRTHTEGLNESRDLDISGLTTFMMMRGLVEHYLKGIGFSAHELILQPAKSEALLAKFRALREPLEDPHVVSIVTEFQHYIRSAALQYGVHGKQLDAIDNLLLDRYDLAYIRRDALRSLEHLEAHQFMFGKPDPRPMKFNEEVFEFWNMNSLLLAMQRQKEPAITVCLIRDPEHTMASFFVFAIRNGESLTILTDRDKTPHPAFNRMSRRPDRALDRRAARNWFPYHLLQLEISEDGKRMFEKVRTALVPINAQGVSLAKVRDLYAEEFVWLVLMFDLIREKYGVQNAKMPELSYTGQMIVEPYALASSEGALVRNGTYKPLELPKLVGADVTAKTTRKQWESKPTGHNRWMADRYASQVPDEVLNPVGAGQLMLAMSTVEAKTGLSLKNTEMDEWGRVAKRSELESFNPLTFGRREDIEKDRVWVARMNQMKVVQELALKEFEAKKEEISGWYSDRIFKNKEFLLDAAARGELKLPSYQQKANDGTWSKKMEYVDRPALTQGEGRSFHDIERNLWSSRDPGDVVLGRWTKRDWYCYERMEVRANILTIIRPDNPRALAILAGCTEEELPWPLKTWYKHEPYTGNHILNRLDPEDWVCENPWLKLRFKVRIAQCKRAIHARRKKLGLPHKEWPKKKEE